MRRSNKRSMPNPRPWVNKLAMIIADIHGESPKLKSESWVKSPPVARLATCKLAFFTTNDLALVYGRGIDFPKMKIKTNNTDQQAL